VDGTETAIWGAEHRKTSPVMQAVHRVYASERGSDVRFVYVCKQKDPDHYELVGKVATAASAVTSLWVPELNRLYIAAPANDKQDAGVMIFEPQA
jgi:lipopolysaccharide biosynthesis protein